MGVGPGHQNAPVAAASSVDPVEARAVKTRGLLEQYLASLIRLAGADAGMVCALTQAEGPCRVLAAQGLATQTVAASLECQSPCARCALVSEAQPSHWLDAKQLAGCLDLKKIMPACQGALVLALHPQEKPLGCCQLFYANAQQPSADLLALLGAASALIGLSLLQSEQSRELLYATVMDERRLMAAEVHDSIAQNLVYMNMRLPLLREALAKPDQPRAQRYIDDLAQSLQGTQREVRELLVHYRSPFDPRGLRHALEELTGEFRMRCDCVLEFHYEPGLPQLPAEQALQVFHIAQEGLSNVIRHANAQQACLSLAVVRGCLELTLTDDGKGLGDPVALTGTTHFGMGIMHERAQRLGATLSVSPQPGGGTLLRLLLPLELASTPSDDPGSCG